MRTILFLSFLIVSIFVNAQCDNWPNNYGSATAPAAGNTSTFATDSWMGEYSPLSGVVSGQQYTFTISYGGCVTLRTTGGALLAFGSSPLVWTATVTGNIEVHWNTNCSSCGTNSSNALTQVTNTSVIVPPPSNDDCVNAITLTPNVSCSSTAGNSDGATNSGVGCATGAEDDDVWYQFVATSANHTVTVTGSANFNAVAAAYTSCAATSSPTGGACSSPAGNDVTLTLSCLTIGDTYYVKVHDYATGGGDFSICVTTVTTPPQDCENAVQICSNNAFNYNSNGSGCVQELDPIIAVPTYYGACLSSGSGQGVVGSAYFNTYYTSTLATCEATYGTGNCVLNGIGTVWCGGSTYAGYYEYYVNSPGSNTGCLVSGENESSWYYATVEIGGTFIFELDPIDPANDYDFAVWGPYTSATAAANCSPIEGPIRCSWNAGGGVTGLLTGETDYSEGAFGGNNYVAPINSSAGDVYIIMVDNFSAANSGYNFNWTGTAVLGCTPVVLPVEISEFQGYNEGTVNKLFWRTISEFNNSHFELERSEDGSTWHTIAEIDGNGTTSDFSNYAFNDYGFRYIINHYRLTQVDINGNRKLFSTISIDNRLEAKELLKIVNTLGQEVRPDTKGLKIYIYSDGTIVKRMN